MNQAQNQKKTGEVSPVERLVDIADAIFERTTKLDGVKLDKRDDATEKTIKETRDEGFREVTAIWRLIVDMLPTSGLEYGMRKNLEIDAHKVMSRCHHRLGNMEKAKGEITLAINLGYDDGFISLGAICMDTGDFEAAETAFRSALAKGAQTMRAHAGLGELYFSLGTGALKQGNQKHVEYFEKAEEEFMAAAKERFTESYDRAIELFSAIGWKDKALSIGEKAIQYYSDNRLKYGDKLRNLDARVRRLAGDDRYERLLVRVGRRLGDFTGGKRRDPNR